MTIIIKTPNTEITPRAPAHPSSCHQSTQEHVSSIREGNASCFSDDLLYRSSAKETQSKKCAHLRLTAQTWRLHITNSPLLFATQQLHWSRWEMSVWGKREHYSLISSAHIFTASLDIWIIHLIATNFCHLIIWGALSIIYYSSVIRKPWSRMISNASIQWVSYVVKPTHISAKW